MVGAGRWQNRPMPDPVQANSFGAAAAEYERAGRPEYPSAAIDWLLPAGALAVLDLGAGTGKLTRGLQAHGVEVVAVEPSTEMREQLVRALPDVRALAGTAEGIPVPDASADAVLVAQAWHWVDVPRAVPEVARVLVRAASSGWCGTTATRAVGGGVRGDPRRRGARRRGLLGAHRFRTPTREWVPRSGPVEQFDAAWTRPMTPDQLLDLTASRSYVITQPPAQRAALLDRVRTLLATDPELAGRERFSSRM